jgi:hypothetical protein
LKGRVKEYRKKIGREGGRERKRKRKIHFEKPIVTFAAAHHTQHIVQDVFIASKKKG